MSHGAGARRGELGICGYWLAPSCCSHPYMKSFSSKVTTFFLFPWVRHPLSPYNCLMDDFGIWLPSSSSSISTFNIHIGELSLKQLAEFQGLLAPLHFPRPRELVLPALTAPAQNSQTPGFHAVTRTPSLLALPVAFPLHVLFDLVVASWPLAPLFRPSQWAPELSQMRVPVTYCTESAA